LEKCRGDCSEKIIEYAAKGSGSRNLYDASRLAFRGIRIIFGRTIFEMRAVIAQVRHEAQVLDSHLV